MNLARPLVASAALVLSTAAPAFADESPLAAEYRVTAATRVPAALLAMVPEPLKPLVAPRRARRPAPGPTSLFQPSALVPLAGARDGLEVGLGLGRAGQDRERSGVVLLYLGLGW